MTTLMLAVMAAAGLAGASTGERLSDAEIEEFARPRLFDSGRDFRQSVYDNVFNRVVAADRAADARWLALETPEEVRAYQQEVRAKAIEALGGLPERTPLNARITGTLERDGYRVERVLFESRPQFFVTAHLYLPASSEFSAPFPAIAAPCGHSFDGKSAPFYSNTGVVGAKRGYAVLVYDPVDQGERYQKRDGRQSWSTIIEHNNIGLRAFLLGESAAQVRLHDGLRAIDYLASRTDVIDPKRIGVAGISGGGTLSAYVNAFESRVACASPSGFLSTIRDVYDNCGPQDAEQVIFGQLAIGLNHLGIVCLRAPSPLMISASHSDFFPFMGVTDLYDKTRKAFSVFGTEDAVALCGVPGPHRWYASQKDVQLGWMDRWLRGRADTLVSSEEAVRRNLGYDFEQGRGGISTDAPEVRNVAPGGRVLNIIGACSIYDIYREKLATAKAQRAPLDREVVRRRADIRRVSELSAAAIATSGGNVLIRDDDQTMLPIILCRPRGKQIGEPVLIVSDAPSRSNLVQTAEEYLSQGRSVAVADIRGFGETARSRHPYCANPDADEEIAICMTVLGDSLVARRAEDIAIVARHVAVMLGGKPIVHAEGRAVIPAVHARYLEPELFAGLTTVREPPAWEKLIRDETLSFPFSCLVRGALIDYDWPELR